MPTTTTSRMPSARLARRRPGPGGCLRAGAGTAALALALVLGACGEPSTAGGQGGAGGSGGPARPTARPGPTASDVRLARVGGVAGFQDALVVAPDGRVSGTTKNGAVACTVPDATVQVLATAPPPTTGLDAGNDRIAASVERDGTTIDLGEAAGSDPLSTAAREVLDDVQLPTAQRTVCR
ncbi:MAG: hypothetical protein ACJ714_01655 [Ornithinibacter sp.]